MGKDKKEVFEFELIFDENSLGEIFQQFKGVGEPAWPALRMLVFMFLSDINKKPNEHGVTDSSDIWEKEGNEISLFCVFGGRLVKMVLSGWNITSAEDECVWAVRSIFVKANDERVCQDFMEVFRKFVASQKYEEIITFVFAWLTSQRAYRLPRSVHQFYNYRYQA